MDDDTIVSKIETGDANEFVDKVALSAEKQLAELPPSSDEQMWADARKESVSREELARRFTETKQKMSNHTIKQLGSEIICTSCPYEHTLSSQVPLGISHTGNVVILDKKI